MKTIKSLIKKFTQFHDFLFKFWIKFPEKIRFVLVGGYNSLIAYLLYAGILYLINERSPQFALLSSFFISTIHNFFTQKIYVFNTRGNYLKEYYKCFLAWCLSYALNVLCLAFLTKVIGLNPYLSQAISVAIVSINTYLILKYLIFCKKIVDKE